MNNLVVHYKSKCGNPFTPQLYIVDGQHYIHQFNGTSWELVPIAKEKFEQHLEFHKNFYGVEMTVGRDLDLPVLPTKG